MTRHANTIRSLLTCGCEKVFDPLPDKDEMVICRKHGDQTVMIRALDSFKTVCTCGKTDYYGFAKLTAERGAAKHRQRVRTDRSQHVVTVYDPSGEVVHTFGDQQQLPLPNRD